MSIGIIFIDLFAVLAMMAGALMVFRQRDLRRLWAQRKGLPPPTAADADQDGAHYALAIFGMMLLAFGLIIFAFFTSYALLTG